MFDDELLDVGLVHLPIADEQVLAIFGPNLQQARVLLDDGQQVAAALCECARRLYSNGRRLTDAELDQRRHEMARNLARMRARWDQRGAFFEAALSFEAAQAILARLFPLCSPPHETP